MADIFDDFQRDIDDLIKSSERLRRETQMAIAEERQLERDSRGRFVSRGDSLGLQLSATTAMRQQALAGPGFSGDANFFQREKEAQSRAFRQMLQEEVRSARMQSMAQRRGLINLSTRDIASNPFGIADLLTGNVNVGNVKDVAEIGGAAAGKMGWQRVEAGAARFLRATPYLLGGALAMDAIQRALFDHVRAVTEPFKKSAEVERELTSKLLARPGFQSQMPEVEAVRTADFQRKLAQMFNVSGVGGSFEDKIEAQDQIRTKFLKATTDLIGDPSGRVLLNQEFANGINTAGGVWVPPTMRSEQQARQVMLDIIEYRATDSDQIFEKVISADHRMKARKFREEQEQYERQLDPVRDAQYRNRESMRSVLDKERMMKLNDWNRD